MYRHSRGVYSTSNVAEKPTFLCRTLWWNFLVLSFSWLMVVGCCCCCCFVYVPCSPHMRIPHRTVFAQALSATLVTIRGWQGTMHSYRAVSTLHTCTGARHMDLRWARHGSNMSWRGLAWRGVALQGGAERGGVGRRMGKRVTYSLYVCACASPLLPVARDDCTTVQYGTYCTAYAAAEAVATVQTCRRVS